MMRSMLVGALVLMACGGEVEVVVKPGELGGEGGALEVEVGGGAGGELASRGGSTVASGGDAGHGGGEPVEPVKCPPVRRRG